MADIQTVSHGEPGWDKKVNSNFAALNSDVQKVGGILGQLQWSKPTREGIVFSDGIQCIDGSYIYANIGEHKLVLLSINIKVTGDLKGLGLGTVFTLPDTISTNSPWTGWLGNSAQWDLVSNRVTIGDTAAHADRQWKDTAFIITALYVA